MNIKNFNILLIFLIMIAMLIGCNKNISKEDKRVEKEKNNYLEIKSNLLKVTEFSNKEDVLFDITTSIDRVNDEEVSYRVIFNNPRENMHNVSAMVVHNYYTEDVFPSIGLFDVGKDLLINNENGLELVGYIKTVKDINDLNLEFKIWIEYTDDNKVVKDIYYKTT